MTFWDDSSQPRIRSYFRTEWGNMKALQEQIDIQAGEAARVRSALTSQLSTLQGDISDRLDRLTRAFQAFVELSDLRDGLVLHTEARRWRMTAKQLLEDAISARTPGAPASASATPAAVDVPDYWLVPVVRVLYALCAAQGGAPPDALADALTRDARRTTVFMACAMPLLGHPDLAAAWFDRATSEPAGTTVSAADRVLWLAACDGLLPPTALTRVRHLVDARLAAFDTEAREKLRTQLAYGPPRPDPPAAEDDPSGRPERRARRTATRRPTATDALVAWTEFTDAASAPALEQPSDSGAEDALLSVVRSLVEEGSPAEAPLLDRAEELTRIVSGSDDPAPPSWDDPAGDLVDLLLADLGDAAHPGRRRLALQVLAQDVRAVADGLVEDTRPVAEPEPAPPATSPAATSRRRADPRCRTNSIVIGAAAVLGIAFLVLAVVSGPGWLVGLVLVAAATAVWIVLSRQDAAIRAEEQRVLADKRRSDAEDRAARRAVAEQGWTDAQATRARLESSLAAVTTG